VAAEAGEVADWVAAVAKMVREAAAMAAAEAAARRVELRQSQRMAAEPRICCNYAHAHQAAR
jgi:hypothetical protein